VNECGWRYVRASVPGVAHLAGGVECQDACAARVLRAAAADPVLALAVADGAGSAAEARAGAELACQTLLAECEAWLEQDSTTRDWSPATAETLLQSVRTRLARRAAAAGRPAREFACTLLGALVAADRALFLQIGDGAIVIGAGDGYRPVFWPQGGEYANETHFVTDPNAAARLECVVLSEPVAEIALLSDGLQLLALHYQSRQAHAPFFRPLFQRLRAEPGTGCPAELAAALERFLATPAINQRTHDDKTLILATRLPVAEDAANSSHPVAAPVPVPAETEAVATGAIAAAEPVAACTDADPAAAPGPAGGVDPEDSHADATETRPDPAAPAVRQEPRDKAV
jgi:hypothetical protein